METASLGSLGQASFLIYSTGAAETIDAITLLDRLGTIIPSRTFRFLLSRTELNMDGFYTPRLMICVWDFSERIHFGTFTHSEKCLDTHWHDSSANERLENDIAEAHRWF
jgi:hypothetical protein